MQQDGQVDDAAAARDVPSDSAINEARRRVGEPDPANTAPETRARFRYQDECVALAVLDCLDTDHGARIIVEHSADLIILPSEGVAQYISIKHREPNQASTTSWSYSALKNDNVLQDLHEIWHNAREQCAVGFWSNAGMSGPAVQLVVSKKTRAATQSEHIERLRKQLLVDVDEATRFLAALAIPDDPLPRRKEITDIAIRRLSRYLHSNGLDSRTADRCYYVLLREIASASTDLPKHERRNQLSTPACLALSGNLYKEQDFRHRLISIAHIQRLLEVSARPAGADIDIGLDWEADPLFIGRDAELTQLRTLLKPGEEQEVRPVVIHGLSGCGKTTLALQFAAIMGSRLSVVLIKGASRATLTRGLLKLAGDDTAQQDRFKSNPAVASTIVPALPANSSILLIIDGVEDPSILKGLIPRQSPSRIVITTTVRGWDTSFHHIELSSWQRSESVSFIGSTLSGSSLEDQQRMASVLYDHPLAIAQAVKYCLVNGVDPPTYVDRLATDPVRVLDRITADGYERTVFTAISLNIESAYVKNPLSTSILTLLAFMADEPFRDEFMSVNFGGSWVASWPRSERSPINWCVRKLWWLRLTPISNWATGISQKAWLLIRDFLDREDRESAIDILVQHSLATRTRDGISLHPLIRLIVRRQEGTIRPWLEIGLSLIMNPHVEGHEDLLDRSLSHLQELARAADDSNFSGYSLVLLHTVLADRLVRFGDTNGAIAHGHKAISLWRERQSEGYSITPSLIHNSRRILAYALYFAGQADEAVPLLLENVAYCSDLTASEHLASLLALAEIVPYSKDTKLVNQMLEVLPDPRQVENADLQARLRLVHSRFLLLRRSTKIDDAVALINWAIEHVEQLSDVDPRLAAAIYADAVRAARDVGHGPDVDRFERRALACMKQTRSSQRRPDRDMVNAFQSSAEAAIDTGDLQRAEELLDEATKLAELSFPNDDQTIIGILATRGRLNYVRLRFHEAIDDFSKCVPELRRSDPHHQLPAALLHYAQSEAGLGNFDFAITLAEEAYSIDCDRFSADHPEAAQDKEILNGIRAVAAFFYRHRG